VSERNIYGSTTPLKTNRYNSKIVLVNVFLEKIADAKSHRSDKIGAKKRRNTE
jgi:hypothetical protein